MTYLDIVYDTILMKLWNKLTESKDIAKTIWYFLKEKGKDIWLKQDTWAMKISENTKKEMTQWNLNSYLNWWRTSPDLEFYWKIAEAIPIKRSEFEKIIEESKKSVLGFSQEVAIDDDIAIAHLLGNAWKLPEARKEALGFVEFLKNKYK